MKIKLKDIQKIINNSIEINLIMTDALKNANQSIKELEIEFCDLLKNQNIDENLKNLDFTNADIVSDIIHLFEFKQIKLKKHNTKISNILSDRRKYKLLVGYANRVQQSFGFTKSVYWYNIHDKDIKYTLRTNILTYKKGTEIFKNK